MLPILSSALSSAWGAQGTNDEQNSPNVSPGLDPGRYAYEMWLGDRLRKRTDAYRATQMAEQQREFNAQNQIAQEGATNQTRATGLASLNYLVGQRVQAQTEGRNRSMRDSILFNQ